MVVATSLKFLATPSATEARLERCWQGQSVAGRVRQMLSRLSRCWQGLSDADRVHQMVARPMKFEDGRRELEDGHPRAALSLSTPSVEGPLLWCTTPSLAFWFSPVLGAHVQRTSTWQSSRGSEDSPEEPGAQRQKPRCVGGPQLSAASLAKTIDAHIDDELRRARNTCGTGCPQPRRQ